MRSVAVRAAVASTLFCACVESLPLVGARDAGGDVARDTATPEDVAADARAVDVHDAAVADATTPESLCPTAPTTALAYGRCDLAAALRERHVSARVRVDLATALPDAHAPEAGAESWCISSRDGVVSVAGHDEVGAMYGAMELAERVRLDGAAGLEVEVPMLRAPKVGFRAANLFLVLPARGEARWWFRDARFWEEYLDMMARARLNVLDLHGMYNLANTVFPNALLYFATSASHPAVGVAPAEREANLAMLRRVVDMARVRGVRVSLMTYRADTAPLGEGPQALTGDALAVYTREAVTQLARAVPGLWGLGFRVGESGRPTQWYVDTFVRGAREAATGVRLLTRSWGAHLEDLRALRDASGDALTVEAKYNGEHLGAPYPIAGGLWAGPWREYSYESYLDGVRPEFPFVFQVRAGGTHRAFRQASYELTRRAVVTTTLGGAAGFSLEPPHAFYPQLSYQQLDPRERYSPYTFRRDELTYLLWGRLAYDPSTPQRAFRALLARRTGTDALWDAVQAASSIVPWIQMANTCGPDHRHYAPELEWGGDIAYWASPTTPRAPTPRACFERHTPFDTFALASPWDTARALLSGERDARLDTRALANLLLDAADRASGAARVMVDRARPEALDVARECLALADLARYTAHKLRAATALAVYQGSVSEPWLASARTETLAARDAWRALVQHTAHLAPFTDNLRMIDHGIADFHWRLEAPWVDADVSVLEAAAQRARAGGARVTTPLPTPDAWMREDRPATPTILDVGTAPLRDDGVVTFTFEAPPPAGTTARVHWKPLSALEDWRVVDATLDGATVTARVQTDAYRVMAAVELRGPGLAVRLPDARRETPWRVFERAP